MMLFPGQQRLEIFLIIFFASPLKLQDEKVVIEQALQKHLMSLAETPADPVSPGHAVKAC